MKYGLVFPLITVLFLLGCADRKTNQADSNVIIGKVDGFYSEILREERKIWVSIPGSSTNSDYSPVDYPVVYLLDGDDLFHSVSGIIQFLSSVKGNKILPEMILVGISNINRERDFTPTFKKKVYSAVGGSEDFINETGGAEHFTRFLVEELIPYVEERYPAASHRTLIGHSYGGLFTIHTLLTNPDLFDHYLALDPSLWWDIPYINGLVAELDQQDFSDESLYLAIANTLGGLVDTASLKHNYSPSAEHIRTLFEFSDKLVDSDGLEFNYKYYPEEDHASVCLPATYDGLRFLFSWYPIEDWETIVLAPKEVTDEDIMERLKTHFTHVSQQMGEERPPPEKMIENLGFRFLGRRPELAYSLFKMNLAYYPDSFRAHCALGEYFRIRGDTENAVVYFKEALMLKDDDETRARLKELEGR